MIKELIDAYMRCLHFNSVFLSTNESIIFYLQDNIVKKIFISDE